MCRGRITVTAENIVYDEREHNMCAADFVKNEIDKIISDCKNQMSCSPEMSVADVYQSVVASMENSGIPDKVPSFSSIKSTLYRIKNEMRTRTSEFSMIEDPKSP